MLQGSSRFIFLALVIILIVLPVISQETNFQVDMTLTASVSPTASMTPSPTTTIAEITPELSLSPSPTIPSEVTVEVTDAPVAENTATESAELHLPETTDAVEVTQEIVIPSETATSEILATATIGAIPMEILLGSVEYQNRKDHSGIRIQIFTEGDVFLSEAESNAEGIFSLAVPAEESFIVLIEAPLHRAIRLLAEPNIGLPPLVLAGGDLDGNGCINFADMNQLISHYESANSPETDINADGQSNSSDLAILTGNLESACELIGETPQAVE
jgi:hypothetical protein